MQQTPFLCAAPLSRAQQTWETDCAQPLELVLDTWVNIFLVRVYCCRDWGDGSLGEALCMQA